MLMHLRRATVVLCTENLTAITEGVTWAVAQVPSSESVKETHGWCVLYFQVRLLLID